VTPTAIVQELDTLGLLKKWKSTLGAARRQRRVTKSGGLKLRTRSAVVRTIRAPVFVLGCPRSGTTFLGQVLDAVPGTSYYFEPAALKYFSRLVFEKRVTINQARRVYNSVFRSLLLVAPGNGPRVIEKNPKHTWVAETLRELFPDARFVFIHRDGRDVALSLLAKPWHRQDSAGSGRREPGGYLYGPFPHFYIEPERRTEYMATSDYHRAIWIWRRYAEEMIRLRDALPIECQSHIQYEELVFDPLAVSKKLLRFLDIGESRAINSVLEAAQTGHASSIGKWKSQMTDEDRQMTEREAGDIMKAIGSAW
jgi:LPS sulfotransferase NodH